MFTNNLFNRYMFAAPDDGGSTPNPEETDTKKDETVDDTDTTKQETKPDGEKDVRAKIATAVNAQVKQALADFKTNDLPDLLAKAKEEGRAEAKMSAQELAEKESKQREQSLAAREARVAKQEAEMNAKALFADKGIPDALADVLLPSIASLKTEARSTAIDQVKEAMSSAVQEEILERTKGKQTPASGSTNGAKTLTRAEFEELPYSEQAKLVTENPQFVEQLQ